MRVLIVYGTTEGQTARIARHMADMLLAKGHAVALHDAAGQEPPPPPVGFDRVILAASLHIGRYQSGVVAYATTHAKALTDAGAAFVSVSLASASGDPDDLHGLAACLETFQRETDWRPAHVHQAAGALRYTRYDFFKLWAMKFIAWRKGQPTDTSQDIEYTDWPALDLFVSGLLESA